MDRLAVERMHGCWLARCALLSLLAACAGEGASAGQGDAPVLVAPEPVPGQMPAAPSPTGMEPAGAAGGAAPPVAGDSMVAPPVAAEPTEPDDVVATDGAAESAAALQALRDHLMQARDARAAIDTQPFAEVGLTLADAQAARELLWQDLADHIRATRAAEHDAQRIILGAETLRYETVVLGDEPPGGRDLFISMHGGGSGPASSNDSQWRNQISLASGYAPVDALWVAPRAPTDDWNMWFKEHIDGLFQRLITNMIVFEGIDPDRVYLNGYSAGGDGVYGLSPRTADYWAGAGMSAGHPNGISLANLRNVAFALHVGGNDSAFDRNQVGQQYIDMHRALQQADPDGYPLQGLVHPGLPHWMNLADAVSIPFLQEHTRNPAPERVVWEQHPELHARFYWLALPQQELREGTRIVASYEGQAVTLEQVEGLGAVVLRFSDAMLDLDQPVRVVRGGEVLFEGELSRTIGALSRTLEQREDPSLVYDAELLLEL